MRIFLSIIFISLLTNISSAFNVTFRLDMSSLPLTVTPELNGSFNNWCGNCAQLSDDNGDDIWEITINLDAGYYEYKFSYDNWTGQENLPVGSECTNTTGQFTNRTLNVTGDMTLGVVCWNTCGSCIEPEAINWELFWSDEFDGNAIDPTKWTHEIGASGWGNNEWQFYTNSISNSIVSDGLLSIVALEQQFNGAGYTSARMITKDKFEVEYGKIEARMKLPLGQGIWPAFWMLGANISEVGWPQCGEIDIMEHVNNEMETHGTVHWNNFGSHNYIGSSTPTTPDEWHTYGIIWDENKIQFYVDEVFYYQFDYSPNNNSEAIFTNPFFLLLNVAVGGNWPGYPDNTTVFPAIMQVDYVRVYKPEGFVGVAEVTKTDAFEVYPNPTNTFVNVVLKDVTANQMIEILDATGKQVMIQKALSGNNQIDLSSLSKGLYFVSVNGISKKVSKQ